MSSQRIPPALLLALFGVIACGGDCEGLCEDEKACRSSDRTSVDCAAFCEDLESRSEATGCQDEFDSLIDCQSDRADVCSDVGCESDEKAYEECLARYCEGHPDDTSHCR